MKITKVRAGYYEYGNYFIYRDDYSKGRWWYVYEWENTERTESRFITVADSLRYATEQLTKLNNQTQIGIK